MFQICIEAPKSVDYLDIAFKCATICIACFNAYFAIKIFKIKSINDNLDKEKDRKLQLLKSLILDHNLKYFYELFDKIDVELIKLKTIALTDNQKQDIDKNIGDHLITMRQKFYDSLLAIDEKLYEDIKNLADELQSNLSTIIFDPGINLAHPPKYDEMISEKITFTKTEILKKLFSYRGE